MQALLAMKDIEDEKAEALRLSGKVPAMVREGYRLRDEAMARMGRVQLLFGSRSRTMQSGWDALRDFSVALAAIEDPNPLDDEAVATATAHFKQATKHSLDFNHEAREAIKRASWSD
jgi:hypothetical protein